MNRYQEAKRYCVGCARDVSATPDDYLATTLGGPLCAYCIEGPQELKSNNKEATPSCETQ